jgi:N utilization substance protein A
MATKKRPKQKPTRSRRTVGKKITSTKKLMKKRRPAKKLAKKKAAQKSAAVKTKAAGKRTIGGEMVGALKERLQEESQTVDRAAFSVKGPGPRSEVQSGDLQGLSGVEGADSESVDELLEEGNAFEADAVSGVEDAENADEGEVRTHEVPEDDVPDEYLDKE